MPFIESTWNTFWTGVCAIYTVAGTVFNILAVLFPRLFNRRGPAPYLPAPAEVLTACEDLLKAVVERVATLINDAVRRIETSLRGPEAPTNESVVGAIRELTTVVQQQTTVLQQHTTAVQQSTAVQREILSEVRAARKQLEELQEDSRQLPTTVLSGVGRVFAEALAEERRQAHPSWFSGTAEEA